MEKQPFIELVRQRTSCRAYESRPVPQEHLELMLEAARLAPSACNKQPWRFAVVEDKSTRGQLVHEAFLSGIPMKWALNAGVIVALGMEKSVLTHKVAPKISGVEYPLLDLGIAGEHLVLQAEDPRLRIGMTPSKSLIQLPSGAGRVWMITSAPVIRSVAMSASCTEPFFIFCSGPPSERS